MDREFKTMQWKTSNPDVSVLDVTIDSGNFQKWFETQATVGDEAWLLAHADDGIIWGKLQNGKMVLSDKFSAISPSLRPKTLQEARLFGEKAEVRLWRDNSEFRSFRIEDYFEVHEANSAEAFDEDYILWGTRIEDRCENFSLMSEGRQGLRHAVPLVLNEDDFKEGYSYRHPLRLRVRHYLDYDADGKAFIRISRLVKLLAKGGQK